MDEIELQSIIAKARFGEPIDESEMRKAIIFLADRADSYESAIKVIANVCMQTERSSSPNLNPTSIIEKILRNRKPDKTSR